VRVVAYDPVWPRLFDEERAQLEVALAPWLSAGVHHVGSTSVPGLVAKPIIDMIAGVRSLEESDAAFPVLQELGYTYRVHRPEAHSFHVPEKFHLHLTEPGSDLWRERLAFRDALRSDPELRREYAEWKQAHRGVDSYTASKRPLVFRVLAEQGIDLKPDVERLSR
jgi:GrpB-like predicted nucleotidyltransferase (UPF0157 family)